MIETKTICPGVVLRCHQDHRFKQGCLSLQLLRPMSGDASKNALLPAVLLRGCRDYPDMRAITLRLDDLYGAAIGTLVRRIGDYQGIGFYTSFLEDRYAMAGDRIFAPMAALLGKLLLEPVTEGAAFSGEYVESEKKNLIATIESERNDKRAYAASQLLRLMCKADSFGQPRLGSAKQVAAITAESLYAHYRRILAESQIALFYVGTQSADAVAEQLAPIFEKLPRTPQPLAPQTPFSDGGKGQKEEILPLEQSQLCLGFTTPITGRSEEYPAMQVCNTLFGGGMTSKLFMNVREKMSLAYSIGSAYHGSKGIVTVSAGIDSHQVDTVRREVLHQLNQCQTGCISAEELICAKEALASGLRAVHDSPGSIENFYATAALSGLKLTPQTYMTAIENTTLEQVVAAANTVRLHTVYFLKGVRV